MGRGAATLRMQPLTGSPNWNPDTKVSCRKDRSWRVLGAPTPRDPGSPFLTSTPHKGLSGFFEFLRPQSPRGSPAQSAAILHSQASLAWRGLREPWTAAGGASEEDLREDLQELTRLPGGGERRGDLSRFSAIRGVLLALPDSPLLQELPGLWVLVGHSRLLRAPTSKRWAHPRP